MSLRSPRRRSPWNWQGRRRGPAEDPALTGGGAESVGSTGVDLVALLAVARGALVGGGNPGRE